MVLRFLHLRQQRQSIGPRVVDRIIVIAIEVKAHGVESCTKFRLLQASLVRLRYALPLSGDLLASQGD